uniref:Uncharacterized protein n=1 Tax=Aplanochytrium stocchinoi TaxID=215587 RepID=A0A7S3PL72_9STRA|mmetsp:Transcript_11753/g.15295  ORF Transcript_11753/g.15295 Transcript_11753/m.15295 type:complete len:533 (-) Transcript_11753:350-1948(-)
MSEKKRPVRRAVLASTGRELLHKLNIAEDDSSKKKGAWKVKGNKRNMSNRELFTEAPAGKQKKEDVPDNIDPEKACRGPGVVPRMWSNEEDNLLKRAVDRIGEKNWKAIASAVPGRSYIQCLQRWKKALKPGLRKGHWSKEEDKELLDLVEYYKPNWDWAVIAKQIPGRNPKQCRERWFLNLDPSINRGPWSKEEDARLVKMVAKWAGRWSLIARHMPGRTENAVKTRFNSLKRQEERNRKWTKQEDETIINIVLKHGRNFDKFEGQLKGRTKGQMKKRFSILQQQRPGIQQKVYEVESELERKHTQANTTAMQTKAEKSTNMTLQPAKESWMTGVIDNIESSTRPGMLEKTDSTKILAGYIKPEVPQPQPTFNSNPLVASPSQDMLLNVPLMMSQDSFLWNTEALQDPNFNAGGRPQLQRQGSSSLKRLDALLSENNPENTDLDFTKLSMERTSNFVNHPNPMGIYRQNSIGLSNVDLSNNSQYSSYSAGPDMTQVSSSPEKRLGRQQHSLVSWSSFGDGLADVRNILKDI